MSITHFDDLINAALAQPDAQRLLLVFASVALPHNASPAQRAAFAAGHGGELTPVMCVDKSPQELGSFAALLGESAQFGHDWGIVFAAGMSGHGGVPPSSEEAEPYLQQIVESVKEGMIDNFIAFNREGKAVSLR